MYKKSQKIFSFFNTSMKQIILSKHLSSLLFLLFVFFSAFSLIGCEGVENPENNEETKSEIKSETISEFSGQNIDEKMPEKNTDENISDENVYKIARVIDGDTYEILINGKKEKIRVLGIDTPEKKGGFRPEGCFGNDASIYAKTQLREKDVALLNPKAKKNDEDNENRDKYGRLLRYVFVEGRDFGAHLITEGYASSYKKFPHERLQYYNQLEKTAQQQQKGMWNPENCEYWGQQP
jgi:micrococcal nuclease